MRRPCRPALVVVLLAAALVALASVAAAVPSAVPSAAAYAAAASNALRHFKSWEEAWAALSPYGTLPRNSSAPTLAASYNTEPAIRALWGQWKRKYNPRYNSAVDKVRYGYFKTNVIKLAAKLNAAKNVWVFLTFQTDWSPNELRAKRKLFEPPKIKEKDTIGPKGVALPARWDWQDLDKVTPPKDQGKCGACFAFAAIGAIESKLLIQYDKTNNSYPIDLSEQQIIDCARVGQGSYLSEGCQGGYLEDPLAFSARLFVTKEALYPFTNGNTTTAGACNKARTANMGLEDKVQLTGSGFKQLKPWSAAALREAVRVAPVMVGIYVPDDSLFDFYAGGIWLASNCKLPPGAPDPGKAMVNHAVLVVGWNMERGVAPYWIVKNSWLGTAWGEGGFARIEMLPEGTYGACSMYYYMVAPTPLVPTGLPITPEPAKTSVRLVHPSRTNKTAGRVEVKHGSWGTVCSDGFNNAAASVVCRQLGLGNVGIATPGGSFGEGMGLPLWLDDVSCRGDEPRLEACANAGWGLTNCGHKNDVGVVCRTEKPATARVVNATSVAGRVSGRLELFHQGTWKPACAAGFSNFAATVVCKQLKLGTAGAALPNNAFGRGASGARLASIQCKGNEANWEACRAAVWATAPCGAQGDVAVLCTSPAATVRLVSGGGANNPRAMQGRLEVRLPTGAWSTVCDDSFTDAAASVVCRQLGLSDTGYAASNAAYGEGTGPIAFDEVSCKGNEATIQQCPRSSVVDCTHREDVGVVCGTGTDPRVEPSVRLRLAGGTATSGRLEVQVNGVWGTVCNNRFGLAEATVACRQLGLQGPGTVLASAYVKPGSGPIFYSGLYCATGQETRLQDCYHSALGNKNCQHSEDVGIICGFSPKLRLANGNTRMGRLELLGPDGRWGTVCRNGFRNQEASVACKQMGLPLPGLAITGRSGAGMFGPGSGPIWMDWLNCWRGGAKLEQCNFGGWGQSSCNHTLDVGLACNPEIKFRLVNGTSPNSGRLEVALDSVWGKVAMPGPSWYGRDAFAPMLEKANTAMDVLCRELKLPTPGYLLPHGIFGDTPGPVWIGDVRCLHGIETRLHECDVTWGTADHLLAYDEVEQAYRSQPYSGIALQCGGPPVQLRLANGTTENNGRLEVFFRGRWGTVCIFDTHFTDATATKICRFMGKPTPGRAVRGSFWGSGDGFVWLDRLACSYNPATATFTDCISRGWGMPDVRCNSAGMAGIVCGAEPTQVALANPSPDGLGGRVELLFNGQWGTMCCKYCSYFGGSQGEVASALCSQLGLPRPGRYVHSSVFGPGSGPVLLSDEIGSCRTPYHIDNCQRPPWSGASCGHDADLGLLCNASLGEMRLVGGVPGRSGRLEVKLNGEWGAVCNMDLMNYDPKTQMFFQEYTFTYRSANTVCRHLGLPLPGRVLPRGQFGPGLSRIWLNGVNCRGTEARLDDCAWGVWGNAPWDLAFSYPDGRWYEGTFTCTRHDAVAIECGSAPPVGLRLADGVPGKSGRLEILFNGVWGTICERSGLSRFTHIAATIACKQMGLKGPGRVVDGVRCFGAGKGPVWLKQLECTGSEARLEHCAHDGWGRILELGYYDLCNGHSSDVGIVCDAPQPPTQMCG